MRTRNLLIGGLALVAAMSAGGAAFTDSNSLPASSVTKGYGSQTISGVTATAVNYNTNAVGDTITSVGLTLTGDTTAKVIKIAFNDEAPATCSDPGTFASGSTTYTCTVSQAVDTATKFALIAE